MANPPLTKPPAATDRRPGGVVSIKAGETKLVFHDASAAARSGSVALCVQSRQEESADDGGSQSPVGRLEFGAGQALAAVEFDVKDGVVLSVPASTLRLFVTNRNLDGDPDISVSAFYVLGAARGRNTRSFDISSEAPNVRVPAFAEAVMYELQEPPEGYVALVSDSQTGETYGTIAPRVVYPLHHRARWIRFMGAPPSGGIVTFFLSI